MADGRAGQAQRLAGQGQQAGLADALGLGPLQTLNQPGEATGRAGQGQRLTAQEAGQGAGLGEILSGLGGLAVPLHRAPAALYDAFTGGPRQPGEQEGGGGGDASGLPPGTLTLGAPQPQQGQGQRQLQGQQPQGQEGGGGLPAGALTLSTPQPQTGEGEGEGGEGTQAQGQQAGGGQTSTMEQLGQILGEGEDQGILEQPGVAEALMQFGALISQPRDPSQTAWGQGMQAAAGSAATIGERQREEQQRQLDALGAVADLGQTQAETQKTAAEAQETLRGLEDYGGSSGVWDSDIGDLPADLATARVLADAGLSQGRYEDRDEALQSEYERVRQSGLNPQEAIQTWREIQESTLLGEEDRNRALQMLEQYLPRRGGQQQGGGQGDLQGTPTGETDSQGRQIYETPDGRRFIPNQ